MKTKINPYAVFGSVIFNLFFFSIVGATILAILVTVWVVDVVFVVSPFFYLGAVWWGAEAFSWAQLGLGALLLVGGVAVFPLVKLATGYIWKVTRAYARYMVSSTSYTTTVQEPNGKPAVI